MFQAAGGGGRWLGAEHNKLSGRGHVELIEAKGHGELLEAEEQQRSMSRCWREAEEHVQVLEGGGGARLGAWGGRDHGKVLGWRFES